VTVRSLDDWAAMWEDAHRPDHELAAELGYAEDDGGPLMRCCDEDRPGPGPSLVVRATTEPFVLPTLWRRYTRGYAGSRETSGAQPCRGRTRRFRSTSS
jgi:hypothetical protein